jgi:DNA polymerase
MPDRMTVAQVLSRFDREIGLDATVRGAAPVEAQAMPPSVAAARTLDAPAAERRPTGLETGMAGDAPRIAVAVPVPERPRAARHAFPPESLRAPGDRADRARRLAELEARHAATCPHCLHATGHTQLVFGEGAPDAEVAFIGEAPGETEDRLGRPFVGPAGEKLDEMIKAMGLRREDTYIANVLKSRPPGNRTPMPEEADGCGPFLAEQLLAVRPKVIVTLGGPATHWACGFTTGISRVRGTWQSWKPPAGADCPEIPVMPTYHPAYVLRTYTRQVRSEVWSDLRSVMARIRPGTQAPPT